MRQVIKTAFFLFTLFLSGCLDMTEEKQIAEYKLKDGRIIELQYYGGGATAPSGIRIKKKNSNIVFEDLRGFDYNYIITFNQISDSVLKITLKDTAYFKGRSTDRLINLNKRIN